MALVVDHISPLQSRGANRHKRVVAIPVHGVVGLLGQPTMVIGVIPTHIHACRIQTLQYQARAINRIPRPRRPRLNMTIGSLNIIGVAIMLAATVSGSIQTAAMSRALTDVVT